MSKIFVDQVDPKTATTLTLGTSGDTVSIPSGVTIANSGTATGFGVALTGSTDNQVVTVTGADAIAGETNLIYNGTILGCGATGASADLGVGVHIRTADSGASVHSSGDELVIEGSGNTGLSILTGTGSDGGIYFGDSGNNIIGYIVYEHDVNRMAFAVNAAEVMLLHNDGRVSIGSASDGGTQLNVVDGSDNEIVYAYANTATYTSRVLVVNCDKNTDDNSWDLIQGRNGGGAVFEVRDGGDVVNADNSYGAISDERIKQNIEDASSQWDDIKALKIRKYKKKKLVNRDGEENAPYHLGVIAQEVESAGMSKLIEERKPEKEDVALHSDFGTVVAGTAENGATPIEDREGNITGYKELFTAGEKKKEVKYSILYMKAIKALQESMERIETLEAKVTALENK